MDTLEAIRTRRSIRAFTDDRVSDEQVEMLLRAAMAAPSAKNERPWRFIVVRNRETLDRLSEATLYAAPLSRANLGIIILADAMAARSEVDLCVIDCALAGENLMLAAQAERLGSVWLAAWPYEDFHIAIAEILHVPTGIVPVAMFAVGAPEGLAPVVDRYEPEWVFSERWGSRWRDAVEPRDVR